MQRDVTSGAATGGFTAGQPGLRRTEALLPELPGLTGIHGQAVYLNQIRFNPSLALRCSGVNLLMFIYLKLSLA